MEQQLNMARELQTQHRNQAMAVAVRPEPEDDQGQEMSQARDEQQSQASKREAQDSDKGCSETSPEDLDQLIAIVNNADPADRDKLRKDLMGVLKQQAAKRAKTEPESG